MALKIVRMAQLVERSQRSKSSHDNDRAAGLLTHPIRTGKNSSGWPEYEVDILLAARINQCTEEQIREIVKRLYKEREHLLADLWTKECAGDLPAFVKPRKAATPLRAPRPALRKRGAAAATAAEATAAEA